MYASFNDHIPIELTGDLTGAGRLPYADYYSFIHTFDHTTKDQG